MFVAASLWFLHYIGTDGLSSPPVHDLGELGQWMTDRDPTTAMFALLRLVGICAGWYLVGATALQAVAGRVRVRGLAALADALSMPAVRHLASGLLGLSLSVGASGTTVPDGPGPPGAALQRVADPAETATLRRLPDADVITTIPDDDERTAVMTRLGDDPPGATSPDVWTVECGDHPWSIAEDTLAEAWGRPPSDAEIAPYWRQLLELNALPDPDLVFPAQQLQLPAPPAG